MWLKLSKNRPLNAKLPHEKPETQIYKSKDGQILFYLLTFPEGGFLVLSPDDEIEPVIAFSSTGIYNNDSNSTFSLLLKSDMKARLNAVKQLNKGHKIKSTSIQIKWETLSTGNIKSLSGKDTINDVRVAPLIRSKWGQETTANGLACYNYYTPTRYDIWEPGNALNYPSGCVATAMAQLMYYYQYPKTQLNDKSYEIMIDGISTTAKLLGGDLNKGPYKWEDMPTNPENGATTIQREAIGALMHDCGLSVKMQYNPSWSGAATTLAAKAFKETFYYSNAKRAYDSAVYILPKFPEMINPNLDAKCPVILGITGDGGHAIVSDGYGYNFSTIYHHLRMGWDGDDDAWYALPDISTYYSDFDTVYKCIYNIFPNSTGEVISGRVTDNSGTPLSGIVILAEYKKKTLRAETDNNGIYAFKGVPSNTEITLNCGGRVSQQVKTGNSTYTEDGNYSVGNIWGVDFILTEPPKEFHITFKTNNIYGSKLEGNLDQTIPFAGTTTEVTAIPPAHGNFIKWTGTGNFEECYQNPIIIDNVNSDMEVTAMFSLKTYTRGSAVSINAKDVFMLGEDKFTNPSKAIANYREKAFGLKRIPVPLPSNHTVYLWTKKLTLYNKKYLKLVSSYHEYINKYGFPEPAFMQLYIKTKNSNNFKIFSYIDNINIVPPVITSISGTFQPAGSLILYGTYFGNPSPKIFLENVSSKGKVRLTDSLEYKFEDDKGNQACMDYISGESYLNMIIPETLQPGEYYIILDNKIGIAYYTETNQLPVISIK
jgi:hypothetical protein